MKYSLSLFNGYGGFDIVRKKLGIKSRVYASEIDAHCLQVSSLNNPRTKNLGDVTNWRNWDIDWSKIEFLIAGSPCQGFSNAGMGKNFEDPRSRLFFEFVEIRDHILSLNPDLKWLLENVKMKQAWNDEISNILDVDPLRIDARLISVCGRDRNYWFNWDAEPPTDRAITLDSVITDEFTRSANIVGRRICPRTGKRDDNNKDLPLTQCLEVQDHGKARCLTTVSKDCLLSSLDAGRYPDAYNLVFEDLHYRKPTVDELCSWHGVPNGYFNSVSENQARNMIGNGWNIDVVAHIVSQCL